MARCVNPNLLTMKQLAQRYFVFRTYLALHSITQRSFAPINARLPGAFNLMARTPNRAFDLRNAAQQSYRCSFRNAVTPASIRTPFVDYF